MTQTREGLIEAIRTKFECWFRESGVDFWHESGAPEELAGLALAAIEEHAAVVPREPTRAMCIHGEMRAVDYDCKPADDVALEAMGMIYRAMLSASPYAPEMSDE